MSFPLKNLVGNHKSARPIVYKGVRYLSRRAPSIAALARELGIYPSDARLLVDNDGRWL